MLAALVLAPSVYAVVSMHPYQTTYFNMRMGGLGGAQQRKFSYSCDYWLNSCRAAGRWLDEHAEPNAAVFGFPLNYQEPYNHILALNVSRRDIRLIGIADVFDDLQPNTYIVFIPRWSAHGHDEIKALVDTLEVKHEVKRQGGLIFTIYYKP